MKNTLRIVFIITLISRISIAQTGWFIQPSFTSMDLYDVKVTGVGSLMLGSDNGTVYKSTNNGFNWSIYNFNDPLLNSSSFKYVLGQSNDNFSVVGTNCAYGYLYAPVDSVMRIAVFPQPDLEAVSEVSGVFNYTSFVAAGTGGNFYIRDTQSPYWRKDTSATTIAAGRNINYCMGHIFVGDNGLIMKADSVGFPQSNGEYIKWRVIPGGTTKNLYAVYASSGATYIAVGQDGIILKTSDFGENWVQLQSPVTEDLYGVHLNYGSLICGANGTILRSFPAIPDKWFKQSTPANEDLYTVYSLSYSDFIAMGRNGIILRTTDGGGDLKNYYTNCFIEGFYNASAYSTVSDTISFSLRSSVSPFNLIETTSGILGIYGSCQAVFGPLVQNSVPYYIVFNHRNSIETWSNTPKMFNGNDLVFDFSPAANRAFGNNMKFISTSPDRYAFYSGDFNQDGIVNLADVLGVYSNSFQSGYLPSDMNGDNLTDLTDVIITNNNSNLFVSAIRP
ncbi:MAG TPA: hypothetical protein PKA90_16335 [Ignavibacteria bacterium]|nr:hypothetical protein [Ignavibacteria bacterium]HMR41986.1 hypothetical protein [Ignavibacteria bacterium]